MESNLHRAETEKWLNEKFKFNNAIFLTLRYSDYLQTSAPLTKLEIAKINKIYLRNLERHQNIKGGKNRLKRLVVIEGKEGGRRHAHMIIEIPEDKTYQEFSFDCFTSANMTNGIRSDFKDKPFIEKVFEQGGLVNYLTKESNNNTDNIDIKNSRY